ncbi:serine/threonine-protein kinase [Novipirellula artificiosorum]|uniref:Serine/threonine-protein kinase PknB n=1 Tax=Novipirellula artificiosorum TaxID=2528016 RepID=A0A5C6D8P9_9BACT|nr:serine/threonine-protein kinase [Novipirellula artificiosorum]TWU33220.1 Serine/threonine-protein kinase PknB [Novipirellula artificiosorum]
MIAEPRDVQAIFEAALELTSAEARADYLDKACGDNQVLRDRIEQLLQVQSKVGDFLESPAPGIAASLASFDQKEASDGNDVATRDDADALELPGQQIGHYKLLHEIGRGGMGVVYMAVQQEPVRRKVAVKIIKPGMDTKEVVARFEAERQALAMMDHPSIAHVLDGGGTDSGRPYFVMELVEGKPITKYCDEFRYTTRQRLELFAQVCQAVQHAHLKGIIHRDLKPTNILVTDNDHGVTAKIIDFGVAKALYQPLTDRSLYTQASQMIGTPLYMSPEQASSTSLDVDTRSDVYSLGVLLYELLTSTTPFERERMDQSSDDEVRRIICEEDPPTPSTRLSTLDGALDTVAENQQTDPRTLSQSLRGELDWIAMKALEKDRTRRYESASELAKDVQRYLEDQPVEACPPSTPYRLKKFARRNRGLLTTSLLVAVVLLLGTGISLWQASDARRARDQAEKNFHQAREAVDTYLTEVSENELLNAPSLQPLRKDLLELALRYYQGFIQQQPDDADLQAELADAHERLGEITSLIGSAEQALQAHRQALSIREKLVARHPTSPTHQQALASSLRNIAQQSMHIGQTDQALAQHQDAITVLEKLVDQYPRVSEYQSDLAESYRFLASSQKTLGQQDEAEDSYGKAISMSEKLVEENPAVRQYQYELARSYNLGANLDCSLGRLSEGIARLEKAILIQGAILQQEPENLKFQEAQADFFGDLALAQRTLAQFEEAMTFCGKAISIQEKLANENPSVLQYQSRLAIYFQTQSFLHIDLGQFEEAVTCSEKGISIQEKLLEQDPDGMEIRARLGSLYAALAQSQSSIGQLEDSLASYEKSILLFEKLVEEYPMIERPTLPRTYLNVAVAHFRLGQMQKGLDYSQKALSVYEKFAEQHPDVVDHQQSLAAVHYNIAHTHYLMGEFDVATEHLRKEIAILETLLERVPSIVKSLLKLDMAYFKLAKILRDAGDEDVAAEAWRKFIEIATDVNHDEANIHLWGHVGQAHYRLGNWQQAREALEKGIEQRGDNNPIYGFGSGSEWWFLAMTLHQLDETEQARDIYDQLVAMGEKSPATNQFNAPFRAEADEVLGIVQPTTKQDEQESPVEPVSSELD